MVQSTHLHGRHADRPSFHLMPRQGWMNDPNGPLYFNGKYHMFYQHLTHGCEWNWGLVWGHAVSEDLVVWEHLPPALTPTIGGMDSDGCFSGCATVDHLGRPVILYTGVRLRGNPECGPLPPPECDLQLPFIETQLAAIADPNDALLDRWTKIDLPVLSLPPAHLPLGGWRDPFVVEKGDGISKPYTILLGSGIKGGGGAVLTYTALDLYDGWRYDGMLAVGDGSTGNVWECPLLLKLEDISSEQDLTSGELSDGSVSTCDTSSNGSASSLESSNSATGDNYFFCISPDVPANPSLYWIGEYKDGKFDVQQAVGPFKLDLGDVLYAPNTLEDVQGRTLLWGWLQERRRVGTYDYSGCLSVPRQLLIKNNKLFQRPVLDLNKLRMARPWVASNLPLPADELVDLQGVGGCYLDIEVAFEQGEALSSGLALHPVGPGAEGGARLMYNWETSVLEMVYEGLDPETLCMSFDCETARRVGGRITREEGMPLKLRVLVDHSCIEVFTSEGEVLSTRVYRGTATSTNPGIQFLSLGGDSSVSEVVVYEMCSMWREEAVKHAPSFNITAVTA